MINRAVRLFTYLSHVTALQNKPVRDVDAYRRDGRVLWLGDFPSHPAVEVLDGDDLDADASLVTVERLVRRDPPAPPESIAAFVSLPIDDHTQRPKIIDSALLEEDLGLRAVVARDFDEWIPAWETWAGREALEIPVRDLYHQLFLSHVEAEANPEELELVLTVGFLSWDPASGNTVRRHVFAAPLESHVNPDSGQLSLSRSNASTGLRAELEVLDPAAQSVRGTVEDTTREADDFDGNCLAEGDFAPLGRALVNRLDPDGSYSPKLRGLLPQDVPVLAWAPAVILRKRSRANLAEAFARMARNIEAAGTVPAGLLPLIDPDLVVPVEPITTPGALIETSHGPTGPLPLNERQFEILLRTNSQAQTLVQGPPGTGKTHTAAALLSHLLAQGKRVLVTAHTDRALEEVRNKLPDDVKPLAVSVLGGSRSETQELRLSIDTISRKAGDHDAALIDKDISRALARVAQLDQQRVELENQLRAERLSEVHLHTVGSATGTHADLAVSHSADRAEFQWIQSVATIPADAEPPLGKAECAEWWRLRHRPDLSWNHTHPAPLPVEDLPSAEQFESVVSARHRVVLILDQQQSLISDPTYMAALRRTASECRGLRAVVQQLRECLTPPHTVAEQWRVWCIQAMQTGRGQTWLTMRAELSELLRHTDGCLSQVPVGTAVQLTIPPAQAQRMAQELLAHGTPPEIKVDGQGMPKIGIFTPRATKDAMPLFEGTRVNGLPPTTGMALHVLAQELEANRLLDVMDRRWQSEPSTTGQPSRFRREVHAQRLEDLSRLLSSSPRLAECEEALRLASIPIPDWSDAGQVRHCLAALDAAGDRRHAEDERHALEQCGVALLHMAGDRTATGPALQLLAEAFRGEDVDAYRVRLHAVKEEHEQALAVARGRFLESRLTKDCPLLVKAALDSPSEDLWRDRVLSLPEAWQWGRLGSSLSQALQDSTQIRQEQLNEIDDDIRRLAARIAADRAWQHAVGPARLSVQARADLTQYGQLVRRLGKGTGKYAARRKAEIRRSMDNCRGSVPVWIMPLYRVVEQFDLQENMFDVVLVDEASQAGVSAVFLQYLAPRIVVIGDDKQVSPLAVGVEQEQLRRLAGEYLADDRYASSWQDPLRSFFDEAKMRFGSPITLVEHRRCMPEIIGFSNEIAYEPDGNRLIPVRQYGMDRLPPVQMLHTPQGQLLGQTSKVNLAEAQAIVDKILECLRDRRYRGKTFGVISLVGSAQAKQIETMLLNRISPEEWEERDLRCGDATTFQGSERDVIFLSMVTTAEPNQRIVAMTRDDALQRFNVAASRAKDQLWLAHSILPEHLPNPEDIRRRLLEYCLRTVHADLTREWSVPAEVTTHHVISPFCSVFEQRIFNEIARRAFHVDSQVDIGGHTVDLVVSGRHSRLAITCQSDEWEGEAAFDLDMKKQRELQRCGWTFFTIRRSQFEWDPDKALDPLWKLLDELEITPVETLLAPQTDPEPGPQPVASIGATTAGVPDLPLGPDTPIEPPTAAPVTPEPDVEPEPRSGPEPLQQREVDQPIIPEDWKDEEEASEASSERWAPEPYVMHRGHIRPAEDIEPYEVAEELVKIVSVEGPIIASQLFHRYIQLSGGGPLNRQLRALLVQGAALGVRRGLLICDNPLGKDESRAYRLVDQPAARVRRLGPRDVGEVPPLELAALISRFDGDGLKDEEVFLTAIRALGIQEMNPRIREHLWEARYVAGLFAD